MRVLAPAAQAEDARQIARDGRLLGDDELHGTASAYRFSGGRCAKLPQGATELRPTSADSAPLPAPATNGSVRAAGVEVRAADAAPRAANSARPTERPVRDQRSSVHTEDSPRRAAEGAAVTGGGRRARALAGVDGAGSVHAEHIRSATRPIRLIARLHTPARPRLAAEDARPTRIRGHARGPRFAGIAAGCRAATAVRARRDRRASTAVAATVCRSSVNLYRRCRHPPAQRRRCLCRRRRGSPHRPPRLRQLGH